VETASFVAVGKDTTGPTPHTNPEALDGERKISSMISPRPLLRFPFVSGTLW
jgi:hypothetical protein